MDHMTPEMAKRFADQFLSEQNVAMMNHERAAQIVAAAVLLIDPAAQWDEQSAVLNCALSNAHAQIAAGQEIPAGLRGITQQAVLIAAQALFSCEHSEAQKVGAALFLVAAWLCPEGPRQEAQ